MTEKLPESGGMQFFISITMGEDAAKDVAAAVKKLLAEKDEINMIFAAAPSQNDFLSRAYILF